MDFSGILQKNLTHAFKHLAELENCDANLISIMIDNDEDGIGFFYLKDNKIVKQEDGSKKYVDIKTLLGLPRFDAFNRKVVVPTFLFRKFEYYEKLYSDEGCEQKDFVIRITTDNNFQAFNAFLHHKMKFKTAISWQKLFEL